MFKLSSKKYFILPNSTSDRYNEVKNIDIYKKFHIPEDKLIIPVLGYFSENRGEKILFDCIKRNVKNILFVFAGDIRDQRYLDFFEKHKNILFLGRVPYLDALAIMKNAVLVPQLYDPKLKNNAYAFPTKYYDCLMVGTPIVVSKGQIDVATEIKENHFGWIIDYEDSESLMQIIQDYSKSSEGVDKKKFREHFLKKYDYSIFEIGLRGSYDSLLRVQD
ncbi:MAG: glycosyltransferase, partial [Leadbetterella sp.]|nr:glycosyltransferase [Leadbetterella sp.]